MAETDQAASPHRCVRCGSAELYVAAANPGLGSAFAFLGGPHESARFDVVICAGCGLTEWFANPAARRNLQQAPFWLPHNPERTDGPPPLSREIDSQNQETSSADVTEAPESMSDAGPTVCLDCGAAIPSGVERCPACGWTYKVLPENESDPQAKDAADGLSPNLESAVAETPPVSDSSGAPVAKGPALCLGCGRDIPADADHCFACGWAIPNRKRR